MRFLEVLCSIHRSGIAFAILQHVLFTSAFAPGVLRYVDEDDIKPSLAPIRVAGARTKGQQSLESC